MDIFNGCNEKLTTFDFTAHIEYDSFNTRVVTTGIKTPQ